MAYYTAKAETTGSPVWLIVGNPPGGKFAEAYWSYCPPVHSSECFWSEQAVHIALSTPETISDHFVHNVKPETARVNKVKFTATFEEV